MKILLEPEDIHNRSRIFETFLYAMQQSPLSMSEKLRRVSAMNPENLKKAQLSQKPATVMATFAVSIPVNVEDNRIKLEIYQARLNSLLQNETAQVTA